MFQKSELVGINSTTQPKILNLNSSLQQGSVVLWKEMLEVLNPEKIVSCGKIAANFIDKTGKNFDVTFVRNI
ncbi:MAG: hypothetical protein GX267_07320 [Fibrobacter sp.]|nr:hypothetical protein [Fibrobacter sp.]